MNAKRNARLWWRSASALLVCAGTTFGGTARAEEPSPPKQPEAATPATKDTLAADLYRHAEACYAAGDLQGALDAMQRSYELSSRPELLFNLGELHRELHECAAAVNAYDEYLLRATEGRYRDDARRLSAELRTTCPTESPQVTMPPIPPPPVAPVVRAPPPPVPPPYWTPARIGGWSSVGAAVALAVGATYAIGYDQAVQHELIDRIDAEQNMRAVTPRDRTLFEQGQTAQTWGIVLGVGAAALAGTGVVLLVLNPTPKQPAGATVTLRIGAGATVSTSF
ncbi:MAG TPA: tetratricopeptide repeat protein [Polyangiaceae bacterium]|nr:tetratricopeptide repeat protein [Polyangiaceae bacterium]